MTSSKFTWIIFCFISFLATTQNNFGVTYGINNSTFLQRKWYTTIRETDDFKLSNSLSVFYDLSDSIDKKIRFEIQYDQIKTHTIVYDEETDNIKSKYDFVFNQIGLNVSYIFDLLKKQKSDLNLFIGPNLYVNVSNKVHGEGWNKVHTSNPGAYYYVDHWSISEKNSSRISTLGFKIFCGLEYAYPLTQKFSLGLINKNFISPNSVKDLKGIKNFLFTSTFAICLKYGF